MIIDPIKVALVGLFLSITSLSILELANANDQADRKETLVDLLGLMAGKDRFRLQYELNGLKTDQNITKNNYQSLLIDEAYSFDMAAGRLLLDPNGLVDLKPNGYNGFFWFRNSQLQESFWLKPFVCSSSVVSLNEAPIRSGLLDSILPESIRPLTVNFNPERLGPTSKQFTLHGLAALLVNTLELHADELRRADRKPEVEGQQNQQDMEFETVEWILEVTPEFTIEFSQLRSDSLTEQLANLRITFNRKLNEKQICIAQLQVLKLDLDYSRELLMLPQGYSCQRDNKTKLKNISVVPLSTQRGLRRKFTLEVTVSRGEGIQNRRYFGHFEMPKPIDSIDRPIVESRVLTWMEDSLNKQLIIISQLRADLLDASKPTNTIPPSLTLFDFNTSRKRIVRGQSGPCDQQVSFKSSLHNTQNDKFARPIDCSQEGVEMELSKEVTLRLNQDGMKLLDFTLQDREHSWRLIDQHMLGSNKHELVYESTINDRLCLYDNGGKRLMTAKPVRLISRYLYDSTLGLEATKRWTPSSTSLLFFEEYSTGLSAQIDFNLLHYEDYNPWRGPSHFLDLSPCFQGPKQSATLTLEYPLTKETNHLRQFENPHKVIREALASHFRMSYSLNWARIPSIDVSFLDDLVEVKVRLLDQAHLLDDSELMHASMATRDTIMGWLSQALRSVLLSSLEACAEYCQQYHCHAYTYCKYPSSCYIFNNLKSLAFKNGATFGSFRTGELDCPSYRVSASRLESANIWRKNSWGLEEVLESLVNAVQQPDSSGANPYTNVGGGDSGEGELKPDQQQLEEMLVNQHRLSVMRPNIDLSAMVKGFSFNMLARLRASYAHFAFDNLHGSVLNAETDPFQLAPERKITAQLPEMQLSNFKVALAGYEYVERVAYKNAAKPDTRLVGQADLDDSGGHLALPEPDVEGCARLCLGDLNCASFSYCTTNTNNGDDVNCITSTIDSRAFSEMQDSLLNGIPFGDAQQSTSEEDSSRGLSLRKNAYCSIMMRTYSDQFRKLEVKMMFSTKDVPLSDVESVQIVPSGDICAGLCAQQRVKSTGSSAEAGSPACLSFDFCRPFEGSDEKTPSACIFYNKHLVSASTHKDHVKGDHNDTGSLRPNEDEENLLGLLKGELGMSVHTFCTHYVRNFLSDFRKLVHRRFPPEMSSYRRANHRLAVDAIVGGEEISAGKDQQQQQSADEEEENTENEREPVELDEISLDKCGRLCEEDPNCGAFEYCTASYEPAPGGLYLSCSLGGNETLELSPVELHRKRQEAELGRLLQSKVCSVYIYRSLSVVLGHKKKNLARLGAELVEEADRRSLVEYLKLIRLDLIVLLFFLVFGFLVRDVELKQFGFHRFGVNQANLMDNSRRTSTAAGRESSIYPSDWDRPLRANEFNMETINGH